MKKNCLLLFCLLHLTMNIAAQDFAVLIEQANRAFCKGDTATAMANLEAHVEKYPNDATVLLAIYHLGRLYFHKGDDQVALAFLTNALERKPKSGLLIREPEDCHEVSGRNYESVRADICVTLSQVYQKAGEPEKALDYLNLADKQYLPRYGGCANGMIMYRTYLSLFYADVYLQAGDTVRAINRLLEFFMSDEGYQLQIAARLKTCLLASFSQKQIKQEIKKAIAAAKRNQVYRDGVPVADGCSFTLFGYTQKFHSDDLQHCRHYLKNHPSLHLLSSD